MSAATTLTSGGTTVGQPAAPDRDGTETRKPWMISAAADCFLILLTPLIAAPAVLLLSSEQVGVKAATISLIVAAFFALGHHLPGLLRAYGDRELFQRFKWRFILAPPLILLAYFPLYDFHFDLYRLIILVWATWHGLMQVYGFVRIYDARFGSTSRATANWDWMLCLCGFVTPRLWKPEQVSHTLDHWYAAGGPFISQATLNLIRSVALAACVVVILGYTINYIVQLYRGPRPNPLKLVMLASGIGTWWFAMCFVDELILGIALFDICHDVQYNAIVWTYNRRLASLSSSLSGFMKFLFRRGAVILYVGLITAYGALGLVAPLVADGTVSRFFYGLIFTSTILHYYYDGFIWKVRDKTNQLNLGLRQSSSLQTTALNAVGTYAHALKWSPAIVILGLLFASDAVDPPLTTEQKQKIEHSYANTLVGKPTLPSKKDELSWLYSRFEAAQAIADTVPEAPGAQLKAAVLLANFGRNDEAVDRLESILRQSPDYRDAHVALGDIHFYRGNLEQAAEHYGFAMSQSANDMERSAMQRKLGEIELSRQDFAAAKNKTQ
ncbi:MAG: hypothetical protein R3C17_01095 [Planctomycetaceae bacterium]